MEILKKIRGGIALILLIILPFSGMAQNELSKAFSESYTLEKSGDYAKAISKMKAVYDESSYETNLRLGWLNYQAGQFFESIAFYNKAIALLPYGIEARFGLVYPVYALGRVDEIISIYLKVLEIDPQNTLANYRMGYIYYSQGSFDKAEPYFEKVVNLYPWDYDSLIMLAWTKLKLQKTREAKILFNKALLYDPTSASALEGLGLIK